MEDNRKLTTAHQKSQEEVKQITLELQLAKEKLKKCSLTCKQPITNNICIVSLLRSIFLKQTQLTQLPQQNECNCCNAVAKILQDYGTCMCKETKEEKPQEEEISIKILEMKLRDAVDVEAEAVKQIESCLNSGNRITATRLLSEYNRVKTKERREKRLGYKRELTDMSASYASLRQKHALIEEKKRKNVKTAKEIYITTKEALIEEKKQLQQQFESKIAKINEQMSKTRSNYNNIHEMTRLRYSALVTFQSLFEEIESFQQENIALLQECDKHKSCHERCSKLEAKLRIIQTRYQEMEAKRNELTTQCALLSSSIDTHNQAVGEYETEQLRLDQFETYALMLREEGGIGDQIVKRSYNELQSDTNHVLAQMNVHFTAQIDGQCNIYVRNTVDRQSQAPINVALASGFQRFALKMAFRFVLWRKAKIPIPDCLVTDEGFGTCDDENLNGIAEHLEALVTQPDAPRLMFAVTHLPEMKNRIENALSITVRCTGNLLCNIDNSSLDNYVTESQSNKCINQNKRKNNQRQQNGHENKNSKRLKKLTTKISNDSNEKNVEVLELADELVLIAHPDKIGWFHCIPCNKSVKLADRHLASDIHRAKCARIEKSKENNN